MARFIRTDEGELIDPNEVAAVFFRPLFETTDEYGNILSSSNDGSVVLLMNDEAEYYLDDDMTLEQAIAFVVDAQS